LTPSLLATKFLADLLPREILLEESLLLSLVRELLLPDTEGTGEWMEARWNELMPEVREAMLSDGA